MKISFCMIVYNEALTLRENLRHLYPHAHEIIVCEGSIALLRETLGLPVRSDDGTCEILRDFPDPERKLRVIHCAWKDKNEMAAAYAQMATGDLVWHVDADEFYDEYSLRAIPHEFDDSTLGTLDVPMRVFWKSPSYVLATAEGDDQWFRYARVLRREAGMGVLHIPIRRIIDGRVDGAGRRGPRDSCISAWHYAWNDDARVRTKMHLYATRDRKTTREDWVSRVWDRWMPGSDVDWPEGVHPSTQWRLWPREYAGPHPSAVKSLLPKFDLLSHPPSPREDMIVVQGSR
jgi:hypothetical protein